MPGVEHDVSVQVWPLLSLTLDERQTLRSNVEHFIRAAFRENTDFRPTPTTRSPGSVFHGWGKNFMAGFRGLRRWNLVSQTS